MRKLKVVFLGTRGFPNIQGGVEKYCEQLCPRLVKLGCEVTAIVRSPYIPEGQRIKAWRGVRFFHLWAPRHKYLEAIMHSFLGTMVARAYSPDIIHLQAIGPSLMAPVAKMLGLRVITTNHGPDYERKKWGTFAKIVLRMGEFSGIKFADKVIVISPLIKRRLERKYRRKNLELIPTGVNIPEIVLPGCTLKKYGLSPQKYVFTACRFVPEKGLHDLIAAFKKINDPEYNLVIAGDADHETEYSRGIKKSAKEDGRIVLTGFISGKPLEELYSNAGLFVLPSHFEGLPIVLLEALSYGLPVVVSNIPQHRELDLPEFRYFPVGNIEVLAEKIAELMKRGISEEEREYQLRMLKENYDWDEIARKTLSVYKSCLRIYG